MESPVKTWQRGSDAGSSVRAKPKGGGTELKMVEKKASNSFYEYVVGAPEFAVSEKQGNSEDPVLEFYVLESEALKAHKQNLVQKRGVEFREQRREDTPFCGKWNSARGCQTGTCRLKHICAACLSPDHPVARCDRFIAGVPEVEVVAVSALPVKSPRGATIFGDMQSPPITPKPSSVRRKPSRIERGRWLSSLMVKGVRNLRRLRSLPQGTVQRTASRKLRRIGEY